MALSPLITFKAGRCDRSGRKVTPKQTPGYIYLYNEDDLLHFCWRPRSAPSTSPEIDLIMFPGDASFSPCLKEQGAEDLHSPTTGRIYKLKFASSSQVHFFWMQSKTQHKEGSLSWFSQRDQRLGQIVDGLLQGDDVDVEQELAEVRRGEGDDEGDEDDEDEAMDVDDGAGAGKRRKSVTGGAGQGDAGGDIREEGESSREGGANGGRAGTQNTNDMVQNFLASLKGPGGSSGSSGNSDSNDKPFTTLPDLLTTDTTLSFLASASDSQINNMCLCLPPDLFLLTQEPISSSTSAEASAANVEAAIEALSSAQKKEIITRVLRSPQLQQSLGSLTVALRDGGLPMIGEALNLKVENGGLIRGGSMPLGGGAAVQAFVEGVKRTVEEEEKQEKK